MRARTSGLAAAAALAAGLPTLLAGLLGSTAAQLTLGPDDSMVRTHTVPAPAAGPDDAALGLVGAHPPTGTSLHVVDSPGQGEGDGSRGVPTLYVFQGGEVVGKLVGAAPKQNIAALMPRAL